MLESMLYKEYENRYGAFEFKLNRQRLEEEE